MRNVTLYSATTGLNTQLDPVRIKYVRESATVELARAVNVDVDESGMISRRSGRRTVVSGNFISVFVSHRNECFAVRVEDDGSASLCRVAADFSISVLRSGLSATKMSFVDTSDGRLFYCNGTEHGTIQDGFAVPWPETPYVGPETTRHFDSAPVGEHLAFHLSRIFVSRGSDLYWSEPFRYGLFDFNRSTLTFRGKIRMIRPVKDGLYISDDSATWFLRGTKPEQFVLEQALDYPSIEWTDSASSYVDSTEIGHDFPGRSALWVGKEGVCIGYPNGTVKNLNRHKVKYPPFASTGAAVLDNNYKFIHSIEV